MTVRGARDRFGQVKSVTGQLATTVASLQSTQDAAGKATQSVQTGVSDTAAFLDKKVAKAGATKASIEAQIAAAQTQLSAAAQMLTSAIQSLILSPDSTPTP